VTIPPSAVIGLSATAKPPPPPGGKPPAAAKPPPPPPRAGGEMLDPGPPPKPKWANRHEAKSLTTGSSVRAHGGSHGRRALRRQMQMMETFAQEMNEWHGRITPFHGSEI